MALLLLLHFTQNMGRKGIQEVLFSPNEEKDSLEMVEGEVKHVELEFST